MNVIVTRKLSRRAGRSSTPREHKADSCAALRNDNEEKGKKRQERS
jgi:hypothetical protein